MDTKKLKDSLSALDGRIGTLDAPPVQRKILKDLTAWGRGVVAALEAEATARLELESVVDDALGGQEDGVSQEIAAVLNAAYDQSLIVNATISRLLTSESNPLDEVSTRQFLNLIEASNKQSMAAKALVAELVYEVEGAEAAETEDEEGEEEEGEDEGDVAAEADEASDLSASSDDNEVA